MTKILQFGKLEEGEAFLDRPGSYAVIPKDDKILLVKIIGWGKYFLPGGGIDEGEDALVALRREVGEETGFLVRIHEEIGKANEYIYAPKFGVKLNKISVFYTAELIGENPDLKIEADHQVEWHSVEGALALLHLESNQWAVKKALDDQLI